MIRKEWHQRDDDSTVLYLDCSSGDMNPLTDKMTLTYIHTLHQYYFPGLILYYSDRCTHWGKVGEYMEPLWIILKTFCESIIISKLQV